MKQHLILLLALGLPLLAGAENPVVPGTSETITIDGLAEESSWAQAVSLKLENSPSFIWPDSDADLAGTVRLLWSTAGLYLFWDVQDDVHFILDSTPAHAHKDDTLEIFLDGDNSKSVAAYDGVNDFQIFIRGGEQAVEPVAHPGPRTLILPSPHQLGIAVRSGAGVYTAEIFVPAGPYGLNVGVGNLLGLELGLDDDDGLNFGERENMLSWITQANTAFKDPSTFGTIELGAMLAPPVVSLFEGSESSPSLGDGWRWNGAFGYFYEGGYFPFVYRWDLANWVFIYSGEGVTEAGGYYLYDYATSRFGWTAAQHYPDIFYF